MHIDVNNAEDLLFRDAEVRRLLPPRLAPLFDTWLLASRVPPLRQAGRRAIGDVLNAIGDEEIALLEGHFGERVTVESLNYDAVTHVRVPLDESAACEALCRIRGPWQCRAWRDEAWLYLTLWR